jgi:flavin-dependent dehydrogenase
VVKKIVNLYQIIIIGGGLAGLVNALQLSKAGLSVCLIEKKAYPFHKVCGEYVSNEVLPFLRTLGFDPFDLGAKAVKRFELSAVSGVKTQAKLPLGGFSLSRFAFDKALYQLGLAAGVEFILEDEVSEVQQTESGFAIQTRKGRALQAEIIIGAYGKRSSIDKTLGRSFIQQRTPYMGVKCHYEGDFPEDLVALHNFKGGYCGLSVVETGFVNVCYLCWEDNLKNYKDIHAMELGMLTQNPHLKPVFEDWKPVFKAPLAISQIYFQAKSIVENGILMSGDAAGMIYPLSGNGMAMAINSAKILSELLILYFNKKLTRAELEGQYTQAWKKAFGLRLRAGNTLQRFFGQPYVSGTAVRALRLLPFMTRQVIKFTHGKIV